MKTVHPAKFKTNKGIRMKLLTKTLKNQIPALYSTESVPMKEKEVVAKFFNPIGAGTWYVLEGQEQDGDYIFFGLVDINNKELGYFTLSELESIKLPFGCKIERDIHFSKEKINKYWVED
jgi:hypothetical protein